MSAGTLDDAGKVAVARRMVAAWDALDWGTVLDLFAPEGVLHSVMQEPLVGREAISGRLELLARGLERLELQVETIGVLDGKVFLERVDDFTVNGRHAHVPVVGVMTVDDQGRIVLWREYYDRGTLLRGMGLDADFAHP